VRKARGRGTTDEQDITFSGRSLTRWLDIAAALFSVAITLCIALAVSDLKSTMDFVGAFASAYISFIVPPLWVIQICRRRHDFTWCRAEAVTCLLLLSVGLFFLTYGTYAAVMGAVIARAVV